MSGVICVAVDLSGWKKIIVSLVSEQGRLGLDIQSATSSCPAPSL